MDVFTACFQTDPLCLELRVGNGIAARTRGRNTRGFSLALTFELCWGCPSKTVCGREAASESTGMYLRRVFEGHLQCSCTGVTFKNLMRDGSRSKAT